MPRSYQPIELNTFVGGLFSEASPLTFPQNASMDEENFVLNKDGSRSRRLGADFEDGYVNVTAHYGSPDDGTRVIINTFKWDNAGGDAGKSIICVQIGNNVDFFDADSVPLSAGLIYNKDYGSSIPTSRMSFAAVNGKLVIATGSKKVDVLEYNDKTKTITITQSSLLIRDFFGLQDMMGDVDLRFSTNVSTRPPVDSVGTQHIYNLRNQTWGLPTALFPGANSVGNGNDASFDPLPVSTRVRSPSVYPSNADSIIPYIYPQADAKGSKTLKRFDPGAYRDGGADNSSAPSGYFIIDALDRGASRRQEMQNLLDKYPQLNETPVDLSQIPNDTSPTGPSCIAEYAGRVWYAGFTGELVDGDTASPRLSSYLFFSRLVKDITDINCCYQAADPTSKDDSTLVDTDGGLLRIEGAYGISGLVSVGNLLLVFANNGVWSISGGSTYGFTATNYMTKKLTNSGCISNGSIVSVENSIYYWSRDGIYSISQNQYGDYNANNITYSNIQRFFTAIPQTVAQYAEGCYDSYERQVKWLYNNAPDLDDDPIELILDLNLNAWYKHRIKALNEYPIIVKGIQTNPYSYNYQTQDVVVDSDEVVVGSNQVVIDTKIQINGTKEIVYLMLTGIRGEE